jgi:hypothetical protein
MWSQKRSSYFGFSWSHIFGIVWASLQHCDDWVAILSTKKEISQTIHFFPFTFFQLISPNLCENRFSFSMSLSTLRTKNKFLYEIQAMICLSLVVHQKIDISIVSVVLGILCIRVYMFQTYNRVISMCLRFDEILEVWWECVKLMYWKFNELTHEFLHSIWMAVHFELLLLQTKH